MKPIYLKIAYKETKKAISEFITCYNEKLKVENPEEYKKLKIKAPVEETVYALLDMFAKFLLNNQNKGVVNPTFKTNNAALSKKLHNRREKKHHLQTSTKVIRLRSIRQE